MTYSRFSLKLKIKNNTQLFITTFLRVLEDKGITLASLLAQTCYSLLEAI